MAADSAARLNMVESQVRPSDVTDVRIHDAMYAIDRTQFMPASKAYLAYADTEVEYAPGRWLLKPRDVAKLLQALRPQPGERALAICAPYAGAVLQALGVEVDLVEAEGFSPARDGYQLAICEGAVTRVPPAWLEALGLDGRLGVIERDGPVGKAVLYLRAADGVGRRQVFDATPPVLRGFEAQHGFAF